ncbi:MAG: 50S ribosomal protein L10 [Candidatus Woesearchaeota archaeon]
MASEEKKQVIKEIIALIKKYPIIALVDITSLPSAQYNIVRKQLRLNKVEMLMTKKTLLKRALEQVKVDRPGIEKIEEKFQGMPLLLFTEMDPFKLYKLIKKSKSPAAAKAGQTSPKDIVIPAGPTPFTPGPIISELGKVGLKAGVVEGKIHIKESATIVKEGEKIRKEVADMLTKLNILPMEIGLNIVTVYEKGTYYNRDVLDVDEDKLKSDITQGHRWAFNLSIEAGILNKETIILLIQKVFRQSKSVAVESNFMTDKTKDIILAKANAQALALQEKINV